VRLQRMIFWRANHRLRGTGVTFPSASVCSLFLAVTCAAYDASAQGAPPEVKDGITLPSIATSLPNNGDPGGMRKWLAERGFTYTFDYASEVMSNVSGGIRRGTIFEAKLQGTVDADLEKMFGWAGLSFHANGFQIHRTGGVSRDLVGNFQTISAIEARSATRLSELWLEQKIFGDKASLRVGQLAADAEFFISDYSIFFLNSDWPAITKQNLPSGGPAYPLSTPGIRLKVEPTKNWVLLAAVFNGDPAGPGPGDPEERNRHGLNFRVTDPPLAIAEVQYKYNQDKSDTGLAGILRLGTWHHFGRFDDQRFGIDGLSLADPASSGMPRRLRGNDGIYGVIDQQIYRPPGGNADSGVAVFSRISASPSDRNPIQFYLDGGIVFSGMLPGRPDDKFGATFLYSSISDRARALDRDAVFFSGMPLPVRDAELTVELSYMWQVIPGWWLQPDLQYVFHPGGHIPDPTAANPIVPIKDAIVIGLRSFVRY
jgi:porin